VLTQRVEPLHQLRREGSHVIQRTFAHPVQHGAAFSLGNLHSLFFGHRSTPAKSAEILDFWV